jgi:hypothetical protein
VLARVVFDIGDSLFPNFHDHNYGGNLFPGTRCLPSSLCLLLFLFFSFSGRDIRFLL